MTRTSTNRSGRGRGRQGRSPGRSPGRGRGKKRVTTDSNSTVGSGKSFFQSFGIDTKLPTNKRNSAQRSPFEGGTQLKKPAPFSNIQTDLTEIPPIQPPTPEATRALLAKTSKTGKDSNPNPTSKEAITVNSPNKNNINQSPHNEPHSKISHPKTAASPSKTYNFPNEHDNSIKDASQPSYQDSDYDSYVNSHEDDDSFHSSVMDESHQSIDSTEVQDLQTDRTHHGDAQDPAGFVSAATELRIQKRRERKAAKTTSQPLTVIDPSTASIQPNSSTPTSAPTSLITTSTVSCTNPDNPLPTTSTKEVIVIDESSFPAKVAQSHNSKHTETSAIDSSPSNECQPKESTSITSSQSTTNYKKVNDRSRNRRISNAKSSRSKTPDKNNCTSIQYTHQTRVTLKMSIKPTVDPVATIKSLLKEFLREMNQLDSSLVILPWNHNSSSEPLHSNSSIPDTVMVLYKYLHKLFLPKKEMETTIYPQLYLGHDVDFETLRENIYPWVQINGHGLFYNMLQEEDGVEIGWLLYSTREMDAGALADEISDQLGVNVGLRWKVISTGAKKLSKDNMIRALSLEVSAKKKWQSQTKLIKLYGRSIRDPAEYPNGIRLCYVKLKTSAVNHVEKSKMDRLRNRQKDFLASIASISTSEIIQLDYSSKAGVIPTLRQMIMSLRSHKTNAPIFHCVDLDWRNEGFTFQFSSKNVDEAQTTINTLLPLLHKLYPDAEVDSNFDENASFRCQHMVWDASKEMVIDLLTPEDSEHIEADENLNGFEFDIAAVMEAETRPTRNVVSPHDDDSVSTLRSRDGTVRKNQPHSARTPAVASSDASQGTSLTNDSYNTLDSRISSLASQVLAQQNHNANQFNAIMEALNNLHKANQNDLSVGNSNSARSPNIDKESSTSGPGS